MFGFLSVSSCILLPQSQTWLAKLEDAQKRVEQAGGTIVKPIYSFPGGRRFHFTDPSGNELAIWSDKQG